MQNMADAPCAIAAHGIVAGHWINWLGSENKESAGGSGRFCSTQNLLEAHARKHTSGQVVHRHKDRYRCQAIYVRVTYMHRRINCSVIVANQMHGARGIEDERTMPRAFGSSNFRVNRLVIESIIESTLHQICEAVWFKLPKTFYSFYARSFQKLRAGQIPGRESWTPYRPWFYLMRFQ